MVIDPELWFDFVKVLSSVTINSISNLKKKFYIWSAIPDTHIYLLNGNGTIWFSQKCICINGKRYISDRRPIFYNLQHCTETIHQSKRATLGRNGEQKREINNEKIIYVMIEIGETFPPLKPVLVSTSTGSQESPYLVSRIWLSLKYFMQVVVDGDCHGNHHPQRLA